MLNAAVQSKGFSLAGLLSNVMVKDSAKYFAQFLTNPNGKSAESLADYLSKPDMQSAIAGGVEGFIGVTTRGADLKLSGLLISSEGEFSDPIKKGSHKATLWGNASVDHSSGASTFDLRRWRRFTSPRIAVTINCASLSPSSLTNSTSVSTSRGTLAVFCRDLLLVVPVAISMTPCIRWESLCIKKGCCKYLRWESLYCSVYRKGDLHLAVMKAAKPRGASTPTGLLTTTDSLRIEAAMKEITTPHMGRASISPNKFTWRFLAINRHDKKAKPCCLTVEAETEREARSILAPHFILSLAARLPVLGVAHV